MRKLKILGVADFAPREHSGSLRRGRFAFGAGLPASGAQLRDADVVSALLERLARRQRQQQQPARLLPLGERRGGGVSRPGAQVRVQLHGQRGARRRWRRRRARRRRRRGAQRGGRRRPRGGLPRPRLCQGRHSRRRHQGQGPRGRNRRQALRTRQVQRPREQSGYHLRSKPQR